MAEPTTPTTNELAIQSLTRLDTSSQTSLPHYFAQLTLIEKLQIEENKKDILKKLSPYRNQIQPTIYFYACWLLAISEFRAIKKRKRTAAQQDEIEALRIRHMENMKTKRKAPNRRFIVDHLPLIERLLTEGKGWRQISQYIKTYHKKVISFNYIRTVYVEVKQ